MANIPIYNQPKVQDQRIAHNYRDVALSADMFGVGVLEAQNKLSSLGVNLSEALAKKQDQLYKTKIVDLTNKMDAYENQTLYDKENGYFYKTGASAMNQSPVIMAGYDNYADKLLADSKLSGKYLDAARQALIAKRNKTFQSVSKHDADETKTWQNGVYTEKENNFLNKAILDRNDDNLLSENLKQGYNVIQLQADLQNWDEPTKELKKQDFTSKYHVAVINALLGDGSLRAKQYYEAHKDQINPAQHNQLLNAVNSNEMKYNSNSLANDYIATSKNEDEALEKAYKLDNIDLSDATAARIRQKYSEDRRLDTQRENDLIDGFYDVVLQKQQSGQSLSFNDIPNDITSKNKLSLMKFIESQGNPTTEDDVWLQLYNMSVNNAQGFVAEDLNKYRGFLKDSEYKSFLKRQEEIKTGKYYTQIQDDDKMIVEALKSAGIPSGWFGREKQKEIAFTEIKAMTRELEMRKGRKITDEELLNITHSLGYENNDGVKLYKEVEQGMNQRAGFIRDVMNDFVYYQTQHNGQMPPNDEKMKIIQNRVDTSIKSQNDNLVENYANNREGGVYNGRTVTSPYGLRKAPIDGASTNHKGIDLRYKMNEPIKAFEGGVVTAVGYTPNAGNYISIKDSNGLVHKYAHLKDVGFVKGQNVKKDEVIAWAGSTGKSTGPHLHYSVMKNGEYVNPFSVLPKENQKNYSEKIATDSNGKKALVQVDKQGKVVKIIREL